MLKIGAASYVAFNILYSQNPKEGDSAGGNHLTTNISVHTGGWHGQYNANLRADDLVELKDNLEALSKQPAYSFRFQPEGPWIALEFTGDPSGYAIIEGAASDKLENGNSLKFSFKIDKGCLPKLLEDFRDVIKRFPVKAN
jgi:hypothetical protein